MSNAQTEGFDFRTAEPWSPTNQILSKGKYVTTMVDFEVGRTPSKPDGTGNNPKLTIQHSCSDGEIRDFMVITPKSAGNLTGLINASGVSPTDEEWQYINEHVGEPPQSWLNRLRGKQIGTVVIEEPDYKDPTRMRSVVSGYVDKSKVTGSAAGPAQSDVTPAAQAAADDVPF